MRNKLKKTGRIVKKILLVLAGLILFFLLGLTIWNKVVCMQEDKALNYVGSDVNVNGTNIRVSVTGKGEKTIVLLSGMGTPSPITDFGPLAEKLGVHYKVVTIEYAGYGLSDDSKMEWINKNVVEEIRSTLQQLGIEPPYILMPHSISGIYCMEYMKDYPEEIEGLIGIDCSVPNQIKYEDKIEISTGLYNLVKFMDYTGLTRLSYLGGDDYLKEMEASGEYTKEEIKNVIALYSRRTITKARLSEIRHIEDNAQELYDVKCPDNIPVLFILSNDTCTEYKEEMKEKGYDVTWDGLHREIISNSNIQKIVYLDGEHYLQWSQSDAIAELVDDFLSH